ncbi:MAG: ribosomal protection-like ABC-F family protein [Paenisporosarcina sp.]
MTLLGKIQQVKIEYGDRIIVKNVVLDIKQGSCIGIVGGNGEGKSTLLSFLAGELEANEGSDHWYGGKPSTYFFKQEVDSTSTKPFEVLSGGEQMKKRLSKAFSQHVQVLLLDEPTNHLDQQSLHELVKQIKHYSGTIIVVSHNRSFLDEVATTIWEVAHQQITAYEGNYSDYRLEKEERKKVQTRLYEEQQKKIANIDDQITSLQNWSAKAHATSTKQDGYKEYFRVKAKKMDVQIRSKRKRLEGELEKEKIEKPLEENDVKFSMDGNRKQGHRIIESKNVTKVFGDRILWTPSSFTIKQGEKVALIGPNGSGKTTWLKMLMGEETFEGELWKTASQNIGYLRQSIEGLPLELTPAEWFKPKDYTERGHIQTLMKNLGFAKDHWQLPIGSMSMGERLKIKLMVFMLEKKDVLILDEPTNHLDLPSTEQLENTLLSYPGTILLVTHDRHMIEKLCNKVLLFEDNHLKKIEMSYQEWMTHKEESKKDLDLMRLETEMQAILGELSFLKKKDGHYEELDRKFKELSQQIRALKV